MSKLHKESEKCFELHKLDCAGTAVDKELNCYLHQVEIKDTKNEKK